MSEDRRPDTTGSSSTATRAAPDLPLEALRRATRALRTLSECHQAVVRASSADLMFHEVCRILVEHGGYRMAWVGLAEDDPARTVKPIARAGFDSGYVDEAVISWADTERGRGPTGTAVREQRVVACRNIPTDPRFAPWREAAVVRGYASSLALPLTLDVGRCSGALNLYATEPDAFDDAEVRLLVELAGDLAYGLEFLRERAARDEAEKALRQAERIFTHFLEHSPVYVFFKDAELRALRLSRNYERMLGRPLDEVLGKTMFELFPPGLAAAMVEDDRRILRGGRVETVEEELDGRYYETLKFPIVVDGQPLYLAGYTVDITERRLAEKESARLAEQLRQTQKMDAVGRLAGGVAHDFNNMLGAILGHVELACDHMGADHPARADLDEIRSAAERSAALTRQLLAFARKQTIAPRLLDLNEAIEAVLKMLRRLIGENVRLTWSPGSGLGPVRMDPSQVDQILANLCINARDAIEGSGTVVIETRAVTLGAAECRGRPGFVPGDYVVLEVRDDGCGMDRFTLEHLFEPFFTTKVHGRGTGLGLATVYGIVRQNHGLIDLASEPGAGTTFHVYLPVEEGVVPGAVEPERSAPPRGRGETLLLVEDEEALRVTFARYLEARGYRVLSADEPVAALALSSEHAGEIRLLVTDVVLPGMNGVELAERLSAKRPGLSVLYVSGYSSDAIAGSGVLAPDVQFLEKPFSLATLAARVHEMLR